MWKDCQSHLYETYNRYKILGWQEQILVLAELMCMKPRIDEKISNFIRKIE